MDVVPWYQGYVPWYHDVVCPSGVAIVAWQRWLTRLHKRKSHGVGTHIKYWQGQLKEGLILTHWRGHILITTVGNVIYCTLINWSPFRSRMLSQIKWPSQAATTAQLNSARGLHSMTWVTWGENLKQHFSLLQKLSVDWLYCQYILYLQHSCWALTFLLYTFSHWFYRPAAAQITRSIM